MENKTKPKPDPFAADWPLPSAVTGGNFLLEEEGADAIIYA